MRIATPLISLVCWCVAAGGCGGDNVSTDSDVRKPAAGTADITTKENGTALPPAGLAASKSPRDANAKQAKSSANEKAETQVNSARQTNQVTNPFQFLSPPRELKNGQPPPLLREINCSPVNDFAISWDGRFVARAGGLLTDMPLWRIADGKVEKKLTPHKSNLISVAFSSDGRFLFASHESSNEENISRWELATGNLSETNMGHPGVTWDLICLPDEKTLVSYGGMNDTTIRLWDISSERKIAEFEVGGPNQGWVSASADGSLIAAPAADGQVALIDVAKRSIIRKFNIGKSSPRGVELFGKVMAVAGGFNEELLIRELSDDGEIHRMNIGKCVCRASFSPDGKLVAVATDDFIDCSVRVFSAESGELLFQFEPDEDDVIDQIRFHPAVSVIATATGRKIMFWDLRRLTAVQ